MMFSFLLSFRAHLQCCNLQIPKPPQSAITLNDLKNHMPIKGDYRYFIKDYMDGEACFVEMIRDDEILPVFEGKIIVKCKSV